MLHCCNDVALLQLCCPVAMMLHCWNDVALLHTKWSPWLMIKMMYPVCAGNLKSSTVLILSSTVLVLSSTVLILSSTVLILSSTVLLVCLFNVFFILHWREGLWEKYLQWALLILAAFCVNHYFPSLAVFGARCWRSRWPGINYSQMWGEGMD